MYRDFRSYWERVALPGTGWPLASATLSMTSVAKTIDAKTIDITNWNEWMNFVANGRKNPVFKDGKICFEFCARLKFFDDEMDDVENMTVFEVVSFKKQIETFFTSDLKFLYKALSFLVKDETDGESIFVMSSRLIRAICAYSDLDHNLKRSCRTFVDAACMLRHNCGNKLWDSVFKFHPHSSCLLNCFRSIWKSSFFTISYINILSSEDPSLSFEDQESEMRNETLRLKNGPKPLVMNARKLLASFMEFDRFGNPIHVFPDEKC